MTAEEIASLGTSVDTIITFDPETFEEIVQVASNRFEDKEVGAIRLVQDWAWNQETQQLYIRLIAYAPMVYPNNRKAEERKLTPFFYKKT